MCLPSAPAVKKNVLDPLKLKLQKIVSPYMGNEN